MTLSFGSNSAGSKSWMAQVQQALILKWSDRSMGSYSRGSCKCVGFTFVSITCPQIYVPSPRIDRTISWGVVCLFLLPYWSFCLDFLSVLPVQGQLRVRLCIILTLCFMCVYIVVAPSHFPFLFSQIEKDKVRDKSLQLPLPNIFHRRSLLTPDEMKGRSQGCKKISNFWWSLSNPMGFPQIINSIISTQPVVV